MSRESISCDAMAIVDNADKRRLLFWAVAVSAVVAILVIQIFAPGREILPAFLSSFSPSTILWLFLLALFCEFIDSSLGMGYGTTLTPILMLAGFAPLQIVPCVLFSELLTGMLAAIMHHRAGNVDFLKDPEARSAAIWLSVLSAGGAILATTIALHISKQTLSLVIGIIILLAGILTMATIKRRFKYRRRHMIILGAAAAFNKGLSGGGYGPLVTAGQVVSGLSAKKAVAVTSLAESLTCLVGLIAYAVLRKGGDWSLAIPLTVGAMLSVPIATMTVKWLSESILRACVGIVTCILGLFTLLKLVL